MQNWMYEPSRSISARVQRRVVQHRLAAPVMVRPDRPIVSFTFDDFPKSSVTGADIVEAAGGHAGFYACTSLMRARSPLMGDLFDSATLAELSGRGHEIGAHSHTHLDCGHATTATLERDIAENLVQLKNAGLDKTVSAFAFPYGETSFATKRWTSTVFSTSRGIKPGVNIGRCDRAQLRATELQDSEAHMKRAREMLKTCIQSKGWLMFFTHDVSNAPSPYGVRASMLKDLVAEAVDGGAVLATPTLGAVLSGVID